MKPAPSTPILDVTGETCPMPFVRTRLALDRLPSGASLRVRLRPGEPQRSVTASTRALGHTVAAGDLEPDGSLVLAIRKA